MFGCAKFIHLKREEDSSPSATRVLTAPCYTAKSGVLAATAVFLIGALNASPQSEASQARFEVASITVVDANAGGFGPSRVDSAMVDLPIISTAGLLVMAYGIRGPELVAPDWLGDRYFHVTAKLPAQSSRDQLPAMYQNLLAERFHLKSHWEMRERDGYTLTIGKSGSKMNRSPEGEAPKNLFSTGGHIEARAINLSTFAARLTACCFRDRPVVDGTGLEGNFDIVLDFSKEDMADLRRGMQVTSGAASAPDGKPSIFTAVRGLGLELKPAKVTIKSLVVDSVDRNPTPN